MMLRQSALSKPISQEQYLSAYQEVIARFGFSGTNEPGRIQLLGWDLEYVCGSALAQFIDYILVRRLNDFIPDNDQPVILDCGANIGFTVLNYKRQFPEARIIAFEPDPEFLPPLRLNLERNSASDVQVVDAAVWVQDGNAQWLCEGIDGSKIVTKADPGQKIVSVRTIDFADYITSEIDLVKLDIEGAEYRVVRHLAKEGKLAFLKNMSIECHLDQSNIGNFANMLKSLVSAGFQIAINSGWQWRDLVRQPLIMPNHYLQYIILSAWHKPIAPNTIAEKSYFPYVGIEQLRQERQLQQMQSELLTTQSELQNTQSQLQSTQSQLQTTQSQLQSTLSQLQSTQSQLQNTQSQLQSTQSQLQTTQSELQSTQGQLQTTQSQLQTTQSQLQTTQSQLQTTQSQLQTTQSELQTTQSQLQNTQSQLQTTQSELQTTQSQLQNTQSELHRYTRLGKPFRSAVRLINYFLDRSIKRA